MSALLRDAFLVVGGASVVLMQFYRPFIWSANFGLFLLGVICFAVALLASRRPFLLGILPGMILIVVAYLWEMLAGRLLVMEKAAVLIQQLVLILAASAVAAAAGAFVRRTLKW